MCGNPTCFQLAKKQKALDRALKAHVSADTYDQLERDWIRVSDGMTADAGAREDGHE